MPEYFPKGQQQLVGAYSQVMAPWLAGDSPNGLVTREGHCASARGSEAGTEGPRAGARWGGEWAQGGCAGLLELYNAHLLLLLSRLTRLHCVGRGWCDGRLENATALVSKDTSDQLP